MGLVDDNMNLDPDTGVTTYDAEKIALDPLTDTVEGRLDSIINKNSPLMQSAETTAKQGMAQRGLVNSSMAIGAGQKAVIDSAMPIAQQDAQATLQVKGANQVAGNDASKFGAGAGNDLNLLNVSGEQDLANIGAQGYVQSLLSTQDADEATDAAEIQHDHEETLALLDRINATLLQQMRGDQAVVLENIQADATKLLQTSQSAAAFFSQVSSDIGDIMANEELTGDEKDDLVAKQLTLLQAGLAVIGSISNVDLTGLLDFGGTLHPNDPIVGDGVEGQWTPTVGMTNQELVNNIPNLSDAEKEWLNNYFVGGADPGSTQWASDPQGALDGLADSGLSTENQMTIRKLLNTVISMQERQAEIDAGNVDDGTTDDGTTDDGTTDDGTTNDEPLSTSDQLNEIFQQELGRDIGAAGLTFYTGLFESGEKTMEEIREMINNDEEGRAYDEANPDNEYYNVPGETGLNGDASYISFIDALYTEELGREGSIEARQFYVDKYADYIAAGKTVAWTEDQIRAEISSSDEGMEFDPTNNGLVNDAMDSDGGGGGGDATTTDTNTYTNNETGDAMPEPDEDGLVEDPNGSGYMITPNQWDLITNGFDWTDINNNLGTNN